MWQLKAIEQESVCLNSRRIGPDEFFDAKQKPKRGWQSLGLFSVA
ncbi:hypothetical protein [Brevibacillus centrosporus]